MDSARSYRPCRHRQLRALLFCQTTFSTWKGPPKCHGAPVGVSHTNELLLGMRFFLLIEAQWCAQATRDTTMQARLCPAGTKNHVRAGIQACIAKSMGFSATPCMLARRSASRDIYRATLQGPSMACHDIRFSTNPMVSSTSPVQLAVRM